MAEVVFRLPSKAVTYGYAEVKGTPEEFGLASLAEAEGLGMVYANYVHAFLTGEKEASRILSEGIVAELAESRSGPVKQDLGAPEINGLEEAAELIKKELGATEVTDPHAPGGSHHEDPTAGYDLADRSGEGDDLFNIAKAPWEGEVDAKPKPWETSTKPANAVANEDW